MKEARRLYGGLQRVEKPCHSEPVRTLLRAKSRRTAAVALCTRLRAQWRGNLLDFRTFINDNRQIFLLFRGLPRRFAPRNDILISILFLQSELPPGGKALVGEKNDETVTNITKHS